MSDETNVGGEKTFSQTDAEQEKKSPHAQRRLEKIHQHLAETLESSDTLQACMGPVCCDLLEMAQHLKTALDESFASDQSSPDKMEKQAMALRMYLKIIQQAEKLAKLDMRIKETKTFNDQLAQTTE